MTKPLILAAALLVAGAAGCTMKGGEVTMEPGKYECRARSSGFEDLPTYVFDRETADPVYRVGIGAPSTLTFNTFKGDRVTLTLDAPPGYYCKKVVDGELPGSEPTPLPRVMNSPWFNRDTYDPLIGLCYEWYYEHSEPCPEGYSKIIINTPTSDRVSECALSFGAVIECGRVVEDGDG